MRPPQGSEVRVQILPPAPPTLPAVPAVSSLLPPDAATVPPLGMPPPPDELLLAFSFVTDPPHALAVSASTQAKALVQPALVFQTLRRRSIAFTCILA